MLPRFSFQNIELFPTKLGEGLADLQLDSYNVLENLIFKPLTGNLAHFLFQIWKEFNVEG